MRILFMGENGLTCAKISFAIHDSDENCIYMSIADSSLIKSEVKVYNINAQTAKDILTELYQTGMYDFSTLGLSIEVF